MWSSGSGTGNRIALRNSTTPHGGPGLGHLAPGETFRRGAVLASFDIRAFRADSAAVIDVTDLFFTNIPDLNPVEGINRGRSWIDATRAFPTNLNIEVTQSGQARAPAGGFRRPSRARCGPRR
jgi:hypothetical protein